MYQKTIVIGHLGRDPEMRYTPTGVPVTSFNVATSKRWTTAGGEKQEKTTWFRVTCWRKTAENAANFLHKGSAVLVEGEIEASAWIGKDGEARAALEMTAYNVKFLNTPQADPQTDSQGKADKPGVGPGITSPDEIPDDWVSEADLPF